MLVFNNKSEKKVSRCILQNVTDFETFKAEARKVTSGKFEFSMTYFKDNEETIPINTEFDFGNFIKRMNSYQLIFVTEIRNKPIAQTTQSVFSKKLNEYSPEFNVVDKRIAFPGVCQTSPSSKQDNHYQIQQSTYDYMANEHDKIEVPKTYSFNPVPAFNPNYNEPSLKDSDTLPVKSSQSMIDPEELNSAIKDNECIKDIDCSIVELSNDLVSQFAEMKENIKKANPMVEVINKLDSRRTTHQAKCDICHVRPIKGKRYTCLECPDFDMCETCNRTTGHAHTTLRFFEQVDWAKTNFTKKLFAIKDINGKIDDFKLKKTIFKFVAGDGYDEAFYEQYLKKHEHLNVSEFTNLISKFFI